MVAYRPEDARACCFFLASRLTTVSLDNNNNSKRDYADIDFAVTQQLEKSILSEDSSTTSNVMLPPKDSKNMGSSEDKSSYVMVCDDCM